MKKPIMVFLVFCLFGTFMVLFPSTVSSVSMVQRSIGTSNHGNITVISILPWQATEIFTFLCFGTGFSGLIIWRRKKRFE
jgi:hypothetical protein